MESPDSAELIVEVRGRGTAPFWDVFEVIPFYTPTGNHTRFIGLIVSLGPGIDLPKEQAEALEWVRAHKMYGNYAISARKQDTDPLRWDMEVAGIRFASAGVSWRGVADGASYAIERFGDKNCEALEVGRKNAELALRP